MIAYLITELDYDPAISNNDGNFPLHIACRTGHLNATKYFITEQKCDSNNRGQYGSTPLHFSTQSNLRTTCDPTMQVASNLLMLALSLLRYGIQADCYHVHIIINSLDKSIIIQTLYSQGCTVVLIHLCTTYLKESLVQP